MMMLDGTKAMRKTYPIVIQANDPSGAADYTVYHSRYRGTERKLVARLVSEDQVQELLSERDYMKFRDGKGEFRVSGQRLAEVLQVLI
jgi:streptomycin 6-kinase